MSVLSRLRRPIGFTLWLVRACLPLLAVRPLIRRKIARQLNDEATLADARSHMAHLMGQTASESDLETQSRAYIEFWAWWHALRWHPRRITRQPVEGIEHLRRAQAEGRGVIVCFVHHAQFGGMFKSIARHGFHVAVVTAPSAMRGGGPGSRQYRRVIRSGGSLISSAEGLAGLQAALSRGRVVASAIDVPGRTAVEFAGHTVGCSAGAAVASQRFEAPIVVATSRRSDDGSTVIELSEPFHASDFESIDAAVQELARRHEGAVLAWPSAAYLPRLAWGKVAP